MSFLSPLSHYFGQLSSTGTGLQPSAPLFVDTTNGNIPIYQDNSITYDATASAPDAYIMMPADGSTDSYATRDTEVFAISFSQMDKAEKIMRAMRSDPVVRWFTGARKLWEPTPGQLELAGRLIAVQGKDEPALSPLHNQLEFQQAIGGSAAQLADVNQGRPSETGSPQFVFAAVEYGPLKGRWLRSETGSPQFVFAAAGNSALNLMPKVESPVEIEKTPMRDGSGFHSIFDAVRNGLKTAVKWIEAVSQWVKKLFLRKSEVKVERDAVILELPKRQSRTSEYGAVISPELHRIMEDVEKDAVRGHYFVIDKHISAARSAAVAKGMSFDEQYAEVLRKDCHAVAFDKHMHRIMLAVRGGDIYEISGLVRMAEDLAHNAGIAFEKKLIPQIREAYAAAYSKLMEQTENAAREGNDGIGGIEVNLYNAKQYAKEADIQFDRIRASEIRKIAKKEGYPKAYEAHMNEAESHARHKDRAKMQKSLDLARLFARKAGIAFDKVREAKIKSINQ